MLTREILLKRAEEFIFSTGLNDATSKLCRANMKFGLAQMHLLQEKYGLEPNACFISSPDETISRNNFRWNSGLGYGGRLSWGNGKERIIFLNVKPNCCGILVGGLEEPPDPLDLIKKIEQVKSEDLYHDNIKINWDFGISNHFVNCCKVEKLSDIKFPPYVFLIHGSSPEFRDDSNGLGLYVDKSKTLRDLAIEEETIFGKYYVLLDSNAKEYVHFHSRALEFSSKKREIIAEKLFNSKLKIICNQPHQFLKDYNNMYLGSNCTDVTSKYIKNDIFPIVLRADTNSYLFKGLPNFSEDTIQEKQFSERARKLGLMDLLRSSNILPHGGGYNFPDIKSVREIFEYNKKRYFICDLANGNGKIKIFKTVKELQFKYRKEEVIYHTMQLKLGKPIARLIPLFSIKL